jgi:prevent-host-death family protein
MTVKIEPDRLIKISELHTDTAKWVEASQEGPLLILRHGTPAAVLIGLEALEELLDRMQLRADLDRRERESRGKITLEELEERLAARTK